MSAGLNDVESLIEQILKREGGFVNHRNDRGGATNYGVTIGTYSKWLGRKATVAEVRNMDRETAKEIYRKNYYYAPRINSLPPIVQGQIFDMAINHGPGRAIRFLQQVVNLAGFGPVDEDGVVGPQTIRAARDASFEMREYMTRALAELRAIFYIRLATRRTSQKVFLRGWLNRAAEFYPPSYDVSSLKKAIGYA